MKEIKSGIPAGARLLMAKDYSHGSPHLSLVLCHWEEKLQPFITWTHSSEPTTAASSCFGGRYFSTLSAAAQDYEERGIKEKK